MSTNFIRVVWYRLRSTFRHRRGEYLVVVLLVGLLGGLGLGGVAGARRTQSAFPTYLQRSRASDLQIQFFRIGTGSAGTQFSGLISSNLYSPALTKDLTRLPLVRKVAVAPSVFVAPFGPSGKPALPAPLQTNEVQELGSIGGQYITQDRVIADQGRLWNPSSLDEVVLTAGAAKLLHWRVGQVIPMGAYTLEQVATSGSGAPTSPPVLRLEAKVVGIVALTDAVVNDAVDRYPTYVIFSPAFTKRMVAAHAAGFSVYSLRLDHGSADVAAVEREIIASLPAGSFYQFHETSVAEGQAERAIKPESIALGVFGVIALLAALLIAGQAISRATRRNAQDLSILRALGAGPGVTAADSLLGVSGAIVLGSLVACAVAVGLSPVAPIGAVRQIDPAPGFNLDWTVLGSGFGLLVVLLEAAAVILALGAAHRSRGLNTQVPREASRVVSGAARLGLPAPAIVGMRFALERGRGVDAVPVGSALVGAVLAVAVVVTTITFAGGLNTLVSSPRLYGWNFDYVVQEVGGGSVPAVATNMLSRDRSVATWAGVDTANVQIDGQTVPILLGQPNAPISPPIVSGHSVENHHQVVLGGATLAQLHKHVGDTVVISYGSPRDVPIYVPPTTLRVVGTATLPAIGSSGALHPSMGTGGLVPHGLEPAAFTRAQTDPDPNNNGPTIVLVRMRQGVAPATGLASLQRIARATTNVINADPNTGGGTFVVLPVQPPAEIVNYKAMGATPAFLAFALALGAVVALVLILVSSVRRRRRDLAILRTLGSVKHQLAAVVSWQASVNAIIGVTVGIPLGITLGRALWSAFAGTIHAVSQPTVPALQIALVGIGALVLANAVALIPASLAARTPAAALLRAE